MSLEELEPGNVPKGRRKSLNSQGLIGSCGRFNKGLMVEVVVVGKALWGFLMLRKWVVCLHGS